MRVLDTNVVIAVLSGRPQVRQRFRAHVSGGGKAGIPAIALFELHYGIEKSNRSAANAEALREFLALGIEILAFTDGDAHTAARIRASLEARGRPIGPYDTLIAAQALRRDATLVTANTREFSRVDGLRCEDWTALPPAR